MRLKKLMLTNFKGIKSLTLDLDGKDASIYGDNATGKTTVYDAFLWLLFDKDSQNKSNFAIKTLDESGEPLHGLDHEVEAVLDIGGESLTLKKSYKEKWVKRRGSAAEEFAGHTTDYYIDGVPVKKSEYDERIAEIANEKTFQLLTSPTHFNEVLHWEERRRILLDAFGDISDADVIASNKELADLPDILGKRSIDGHRKMIEGRRSEINKELQRIPVRIDEATRSLPDISNIDPKTLPKDIAKVKDAMDKQAEEIAQLKAGGGVAEKTKQLREVEAEILKLQNERNRKRQAEINEKQAEADQIKREIARCEAVLERIADQQRGGKAQIVLWEEEMEALREEWYQLRDRQFEQDDTCPTCGQPLPDDQAAEAKANFNRQKAERMERITADGKDFEKNVSALERELARAKEEKSRVEANMKTHQEALKSTETKIKAIKEATSETPEIIKLVEQKESLEAEIDLIKSGGKGAVDKLHEDLAGLEQILDALKDEERQLDDHATGQKRIEELKAEEKKLAKEHEKIERELHLMDLFIRTKSSLLDKQINSHFELAKFKLFDVLVNGSVVPCCETLHNGVPYSTGLNNSARINVGLDIIRTLSKHYGFSPPIFIDNAEAVVQLLPMEAQMIRLVVSAKHKKLRVETEEK